ncbi:MAG: VOC family protein [Pseudomonadota bacterium]
MTQITPFILCSDLGEALSFYCDVLGFEAGFVTEGLYAFIRRDAAAIRLLQASPELDLSSPDRQNSCYIDVDDVDELYAQLKARLDGLPEGRVRPPFDQQYGQREFHVHDQDCTLLFFGAAIAD